MKILISSRSFGKVDRKAIELIEKEGFIPVLNPYGRKLTESEIIELLDDETVAILAGTEKITENIMANAISLKVISRYGIGLDNVDLDAAKKRGIVVCATSDAPCLAVAELALSLILDLSRKIALADKNVRSGKWVPLMGQLVSGKSLGIIGLGRIGKNLVKLVQPFNLNIYATDTYPDLDFSTSYNVKIVSLDTLLSKSDIISLHLPLDGETYRLIDKDQFSVMKPESIIINTARGGLINEEALLEALKNNKIAGAALDVYEKEPYSGELKNYDNVILTPHIGSCAKETRMKMEMETVNNAIKILKEGK